MSEGHGIISTEIIPAFICRPTRGRRIFMSQLLKKTAWPMAIPAPYSFFHIAFSLTGILLAAFVAVCLAGRCRHNPTKSASVIAACGIILALGETYKQLFLYIVVNQGAFDWWYFPFQLCSTPMYLCLALPAVKGFPSVQQTICTYLQDFSLLGGVMALLEPSGLLHPYWVLTLHGLIWHILLIFLGLFCCLSGISGHGKREYVKTLILLGSFCLIAFSINIITKGKADMFYISPYYPVTQVFFNQISLDYGTLAGILMYLAAICLGGFLLHVSMDFLTNHSFCCHGRKL